MTADAENLMLEILKQVQADISDLKFDVHDLKTRMTTVEEHLGNSLIATSGINARLDRLNGKVERIETPAKYFRGDVIHG